MKKIVLLLVVLSTFTLSSCVFEKIDYSAFESHYLSTYSEAESISNNKYILYYYEEDCESCETIKGNILDYFDTSNLLEFYLLDTSNSEVGASSFGKFDGEPIIYIISDNHPIETYTGVSEIKEFINKYKDIDLDYDVFESQHLTTYQDVLDIENDSYILYYYLDSCPHCIATKDDFLKWAFTKSLNDVYFMEGSRVDNPDQIPTELLILNSGTPIIIVMSNGEFADEYYSGKEEVLNYIDFIGSGDIISENMRLDYDHFSEIMITDHINTLTISDNAHIEYFYSPYCSFCNAIKNDVLEFFDQQDSLEVYLMDMSTSTGLPKIPSLTGVPALYVVIDNEVTAEFKGTLQITNFILDYMNGKTDLSEYE